MSLTLILCAMVLGVLRLDGVASQSFQAVAHLFVGGLIGAYFANGNKLHLWLAVGLSVLELFAFMMM